jgi:hypothetical protein
MLRESEQSLADNFDERRLMAFLESKFGPISFSQKDIESGMQGMDPDTIDAILSTAFERLLKSGKITSLEDKPGYFLINYR